MLKNTLKSLITLIILFQTTYSTAQQPNDCVNAVTVCGDSDIVLDVNQISTEKVITLSPSPADYFIQISGTIRQ